MKKILAFGASSSKNSINKKLASFTAHQIANAEVTILDLNDFEMPIFSVDKEQEDGIPSLAHDFHQHIKNVNGIVVSFAEHNGSYSSAFKNILDWYSRIDQDRFDKKPIFIMGTSPGARGAATVLGAVKAYWPFMNASIVAEFSLPKFFENFDANEGITDEGLRQEYEKQCELFSIAIHS